MSVTMLVNVNTADKEELKKIPGVGERVARLLIQFREVYCVIKKEALNLALRGKLPAEALDMIDFSVPRQDDPFDIDLSCLPAVPKTNSWEPLVSFAHETAARQSRYQVGESFAMSASEQESSPKLAGASSMHESQESRSCRTDSRPVSQCDEEDAKPSVSKTSSSKSANHSSGKSDAEGEKKNRTASGSRSQRHSRSSQGGMGSCRSKSPKAYRSSSRSRSPSSRRHSRKHSPKKTRRRHSKGSSSVSRSRSHSSSVSRSRSVKRHSRKTEKKVTKKKKYDSSTSASRSRSASRSSRSASRSSSRSLSRSHKRRTKSKGDKSRVNKHKNRLSSRSRSSSRSNSRSSHKKKIKTRRAKSKVHKHKRHALSCSESQSRSRSRSRSRRTETRSKKTQRRSHRHSPHSDSDTDSSVDRCSRHGNPRKHPKALRFDGKTNWLSFKKKFDSYRKVMRWSEEESKDYLMWSLEGKALDFLTITKIDLEKYSFRKIMKKLETRFGVKELTETSKAKFRQAFQKQDESLKEWADRVMTLATPAFVDLPEDHMKKKLLLDSAKGALTRRQQNMPVLSNLGQWTKHWIWWNITSTFLRQWMERRRKENMKLQWMRCNLHQKLELNNSSDQH